MAPSRRSYPSSLNTETFLPFRCRVRRAAAFITLLFRYITFTNNQIAVLSHVTLPVAFRILSSLQHCLDCSFGTSFFAQLPEVYYYMQVSLLAGSESVQVGNAHDPIGATATELRFGRLTTSNKQSWLLWVKSLVVHVRQSGNVRLLTYINRSSYDLPSRWIFLHRSERIRRLKSRWANTPLYGLMRENGHAFPSFLLLSYNWQQLPTTCLECESRIVIPQWANKILLLARMCQTK